MPLNAQQVVVAALIMGVVTFITRALPFWLFSGGDRPSKNVLYLSKYLPPAIIAMLVIYCFRNSQLSVWPHALPEIIGAACVALLHLWKRNNIISIFGGTAIYMLMVQGVFV